MNQLEGKKEISMERDCRIEQLARSMIDDLLQQYYTTLLQWYNQHQMFSDQWNEEDNGLLDSIAVYGLRKWRSSSLHYSLWTCSSTIPFQRSLRLPRFANRSEYIILRFVDSIGEIWILFNWVSSRYRLSIEWSLHRVPILYFIITYGSLFGCITVDLEVSQIRSLIYNNLFKRFTLFSLAIPMKNICWEWRLFFRIILIFRHSTKYVSMLWMEWNRKWKSSPVDFQAQTWIVSSKELCVSFRVIFKQSGKPLLSGIHFVVERKKNRNEEMVMVLTYVNPSMTRDEFKDYVLRCMCFAVLMNRIVNTKNPVCSAYQQLLMDNIIPVYGHQYRSNVHRWFINSSLNLTLCCPSIICLHYTTIIS